MEATINLYPMICTSTPHHLQGNMRGTRVQGPVQWPMRLAVWWARNLVRQVVRFWVYCIKHYDLAVLGVVSQSR